MFLVLTSSGPSDVKLLATGITHHSLSKYSAIFIVLYIPASRCLILGVLGPSSVFQLRELEALLYSAGTGASVLRLTTTHIHFGWQTEVSDANSPLLSPSRPPTTSAHTERTLGRQYDHPPTRLAVRPGFAHTPHSAARHGKTQHPIGRCQQHQTKESMALASALQIPYRESREGFWGQQTSTLNWCEEVQ